MDKYVYDSELGQNFGFEFDKSQFGDLKLTAAMVQLKEHKQNPIFYITIGGSIFSGPVVYRNKLYFGAADKIFYCLSKEGEKIWQFETNGPIPGLPAFHDGMLFFGSYDNCFYAVDSETGELIWKFNTEDKIFCSPFVHNNLVFFGSKDFNVYALDEKTGKLAWKFKTGGEITSYPLVYNNMLFIGSGDKNLYALTLEGEMLWRFPTNGSVRFGMAAGNGVIYFGSMDKNVYGVDLNGKQVFRFMTHDCIGNTLTFCDGIIYVGSRDKNFYAIKEDGTLFWKVELNDMADSGACYNGVVYIGGCDNTIRAVDSNTRRIIWKFKTNAPITSVPIVHENALFFGCWDCNLYSLNLNGELNWKFPTSMSSMSSLDLPEPPISKSTEVVWDIGTEGVEKKRGDEVDIADYGEFSGTYIDTSKTDYLGHKKKGYKSN